MKRLLAPLKRPTSLLAATVLLAPVAAHARSPEPLVPVEANEAAPPPTPDSRCKLDEVQRIEKSVHRAMVRVHDGSTGWGFMIDSRRVVTSWSLLVMRRGPEVVLADGSRYSAKVIDVEDDVAILELAEQIRGPRRENVETGNLRFADDFLDAPPHLLLHAESSGQFQAEYVKPESNAEAEAGKPRSYGARASNAPERGLPILDCQGRVLGMVQGPTLASYGNRATPERRHLLLLKSLVEGRAEPYDPGTTRFGFSYEGLTGMFDERGIGGIGISFGPRVTFEDRIQLDLRGDAFLLFNQHHIGGRFSGRAALGPRLRLSDWLYFVPQLGAGITVTTTALVPQQPGGAKTCGDDARCQRIDERLDDIEGQARFVPYGRVALETNLAEGIIGGSVFYELHVDPKDDYRSHRFGFGMHF